MQWPVFSTRRTSSMSRTRSDEVTAGPTAVPSDLAAAAQPDARAGGDGGSSGGPEPVPVAAPVAPPVGGSPAVHTVDLRKVYHHTVALQGLSMTVGRGEVFGFL